MSNLILEAFSFHAMGTACELQLYAPSLRLARQAAEAAIGDVARLESKYSRYRADSLLSRINAVAATGGSLNLDEESASLMDYACTCHQQSGGLFDITSGILRRAWDFKSGKAPQAAAVSKLLARIGWQRLQWHKPILSFPEPGMEIDLGGIVKEYAADRLATLCQERGIQHGIINLGGDIRIIGPHPDGTPWRIGIKDPRQADTVLVTLELHGGAVASSGDYERCVVVDGVRYGHILNPHNGWPVKVMAAVTVVADYCVVAGSAATIGMLKEAQGKQWLAELGLGHCWVDVEGNAGFHF